MVMTIRVAVEPSEGANMTHQGPERRKMRRTWTAWTSVFYIAIVLLVGVAVQMLYERTSSDIKTLAIQTCESVNVGREATNEQSRVTRQFLLLGAKSRRNDADVARTQNEREENLQAAASLESLADTYQEVDLADCRYPPPSHDE
jgi:hypothetical protein